MCAANVTGDGDGAPGFAPRHSREESGDSQNDKPNLSSTGHPLLRYKVFLVYLLGTACAFVSAAGFWLVALGHKWWLRGLGGVICYVGWLTLHSILGWGLDGDWRIKWLVLFGAS